MSEKVIAHYSNGTDLLQAIRNSLARAGMELNALKAIDLAPVDEFHTRGRKATLEVAEAMDLTPNSLVLDIGCGIGGPARTIAETFGCRVIGVDLSEAYCTTANELSAWTSLDRLVTFRQSDASKLPFEDDSFDAAVTIHVGMNIADKYTMYSEIHRVLKPGSVFAIYDVLKGDGGEVYFPVPWARDSSISFLATPREMSDMLDEAGFQIVSENDSTRKGYEWFVGALNRIKESGPPPLSLRTLLGDEFPEMVENLARSLDQRRALVYTYICRA